MGEKLPINSMEKGMKILKKKREKRGETIDEKAGKNENRQKMAKNPQKLVK